MKNGEKATSERFFAVLSGWNKNVMKRPQNQKVPHTKPTKLAAPF
jgi:hypothetical protein